jgi:hypothetical protein
MSSLRLVDDLFTDSGSSEDDLIDNDSDGNGQYEELPECLVEGRTTPEPAFPDRPMFNLAGDKDLACDLELGWKGVYRIPTESGEYVDNPTNDIGCETDLHCTLDKKGTLNFTPASSGVLAWFDALFDNNMWQVISDQTNRYARGKLYSLGPDEFEQTQHANYLPHARINKWKDTDPSELKVFFSHMILMGLTRKPELESYWRQDQFSRMPFFGKYLSRDRFTALLSNLHVADDTNNPKYGEANHDPLAKLRPFIDMLDANFVSKYNPARNMSVDEACCPFKGRLHFKCYNPNKPHKFHIKVFVCSESASGFMSAFKVYAGKGTCHRQGETIDPECGVTTQTVMTLVSDAKILNQSRILFFDNFYSSPELFEELLYKETLACGTVRSNRKGLPTAVVQTKLKNKDDVVFRRKADEDESGGGILALKWLEKKKPVMLISTAHNASWKCTGKRLRDQNRTPVYKPTAVVEYTRNMGGVDLSDQLMSYYHFLRRSCKWSTKLFMHLVGMVMLNAFILNKKFGDNQKLSHYDFREQLAKELLREGCSEVEVRLSLENRWLFDRNPDRLKGRHFPIKIPQRKRQTCGVCRVTKRDQQQGKDTYRRRKTLFQCDSCELPMCLLPCFKLYHTKENYKECVDIALLQGQNC